MGLHVPPYLWDLCTAFGAIRELSTLSLVSRRQEMNVKYNIYIFYIADNITEHYYKMF